MEIEELLLRTIEDLRDSSDCRDRYELVKASGALRLLLLDKQPLISQVNRKHRLKIEFKVPGSIQNLRNLGMDVMWWSLSPWGTSPPLSLQLDRLLATVCLVIGREEFTIKDVILAGAHLKGGVHASKLLRLTLSETRNLELL